MIKLNRGSLFIPAIGFSMVRAWIKNYTHKEYDLTVFSDKSFFKYDYILQTAYWGIKNHGMNFREKIGFPKNKILFGDSGGFQIKSFGLRGDEITVNESDVLKWLERNVDIGFNLDVPPQPNTVVPCMKESIKNFEFFEKNRKNYDMKIYNVLHGYNYADLKMWYDHVKDFNFDGWAIGSGTSKESMLQAISCLYLFLRDELNDKDMHYFGTTGLDSMCILSYLGEKVKRCISYDSSSYKLGSTHKVYVMPSFVGEKLYFGNKVLGLTDKVGNIKIKSNLELEELPCKCPVCRKITISEIREQTTKSNILIDLHNMYQYIEIANRFRILSRSRHKLTEYLRGIISVESTIKKVNKTLDFIDYVLERSDLDKGIRKFNVSTFSNANKSKKSILSYC